MVVAVWLLVTAIAAPLAIAVSGSLSGAGWDPQGTTAADVREELRRDFPGVGAESAPTSTAGWSASNCTSPVWRCSAPAPVKRSIRLRLCVPFSHWLVAVNWNFASSGCALTALMVAKRVGVSTPFIGTRSRDFSSATASAMAVSPLFIGRFSGFCG